MSTIPQRSRQQRALDQRERELVDYMEMEEEVLPEDSNVRNRTSALDKATKAKRDIDNLKRKLSRTTAA